MIFITKISCDRTAINGWEADTYVGWKDRKWEAIKKEWSILIWNADTTVLRYEMMPLPLVVINSYKVLLNVSRMNVRRHFLLKELLLSMEQFATLHRWFLKRCM